MAPVQVRRAPLSRGSAGPEACVLLFPRGRERGQWEPPGALPGPRVALRDARRCRPPQPSPGGVRTLPGSRWATVAHLPLTLSRAQPQYLGLSIRGALQVPCRARATSRAGGGVQKPVGISINPAGWALLLRLQTAAGSPRGCGNSPAGLWGEGARGSNALPPRGLFSRRPLGPGLPAEPRDPASFSFRTRHRGVPQGGSSLNMQSLPSNAGFAVPMQNSVPPVKFGGENGPKEASFHFREFTPDSASPRIVIMACLHPGGSALTGLNPQRFPFRSGL